MSMTDDSYLSIDATSEGSYKEKGSKFLSFLLPVKSEEESKQRLSEFRKKYYDARHVCYAIVLGPEWQLMKASDAGEPAHTAGDPILNEIRATGITNVLLVVVRYFGGTKLGKSGLISAYKEAAADALKNCTVVEKFVMAEFQIKFQYHQSGEVMNTLSALQATINSQEFETDCAIQFSVKRSKAEEARKKLEKYLLREE